MRKHCQVRMLLYKTYQWELILLTSSFKRITNINNLFKLVCCGLFSFFFKSIYVLAVLFHVRCLSLSQLRIVALRRLEKNHTLDTYFQIKPGVCEPLLLVPFSVLRFLHCICVCVCPCHYLCSTYKAWKDDQHGPGGNRLVYMQTIHEGMRDNEGNMNRAWMVWWLRIGDRWAGGSQVTGTGRNIWGHLVDRWRMAGDRSRMK